ncbi:MAG TPA: UDP-N-acetylmuramoyl-L-alanyl-D-glutamate--2,6-diaminopimelate ligase, partial [Micromonosporaceae bacterium]
MPGYPRPSRIAEVPLADLAAISGAQLRRSGPDPQPAAAAGHQPPVTVRGVTHDSASVRPGDLYAGLPGARRHGAEFAADA